MALISRKWLLRLSPLHNSDIAWFYIFLPAVIAYVLLLNGFVNQRPLLGTVESYDASFDRLLYKGYGMEVIVEGLEWSEGPLWIEDESNSFLAFSDTVKNKIYRWDAGKGFFTIGKSLMFKDTGCYSNHSHCQGLLESGSNGLVRIPPSALDPSTVELFVCQHGERSVGVLKANGTRFSLASHFKGRRFNSPNDLVLSPEGNLYFTDPRFGLVTKDGESIAPDLPVAGIFMVKKADIDKSLETFEPTKNTVILARDLSHPNGLAFSPDYSLLYVSNSNSTNSVIKAYEVRDDGSLGQGKVFFSGNGDDGSDAVDSFDGLKVDIHGNVFAAASNGVLVLDPTGKLIGRLRLEGRKVSNVAFSNDGVLFITTQDLVLRLWTRTKPNRLLTRH